MPIARFARTLLAAACLLLVVPAIASAAQTVDTTADEPDQTPGGACSTAAGKCSLRAAIEVTNLLGGTENILFDATVFEGQMADVITPSTPLPAITAQVLINAGTCMTAAGVLGPCAGVEGPSGQSALKVESGSVIISGLAITGAQTGINVSGGRDEFISQGNWIGVKLDGSAGANGTGIFLDAESNEAFIGGKEAVRRNVISNNSVNGLQINGADEAKILGNYFGVTPAGDAAAPNGKSIEITNTAGSPEYEANDNEIGATVAGTSAACDEGCNVISGSTVGIDLQGNGVGLNEKPATGPTTISGNFVGLDAAGAAAIGATTFGINAGEAADVHIGSEAEGDANYIAGGAYGIYAEDGPDLEVIQNRIGWGPNGGMVTPPSIAGIFSFTLDLASLEDRPIIAGNLIRMIEGSGLEQVFGLAEVTGNSFQGGVNNILTRGNGVTGALIEDNDFGASTGAAIQLRNDGNEVLGNRITLAGGAGVEVASVNLGFGFPLVTGNLIGGTLPSEQNMIILSGGSAIKILDVEEGQNEIGRNVGGGNGTISAAAFIDLAPVELGEDGPAEGIQPPAITTAKQSEAKGTALPGATVRVFRKAIPSPGELNAFLGETTANGSGDWTLVYAAPVSGAALVTATQTNPLGGTSELSAAVSTVPDPTPPCTVNCGPPAPPPDTTKPKVTIKKAPKAKSKNTTAKFVFSSSKAGSKFKCKLDNKAFANCKSPKTYKKLKPGKHVFKVKATDSAGNTGAVITRKFTVLE